MDVQALSFAAIVAPQADPAQAQNQANNASPTTPGISAVGGSVTSGASPSAHAAKTSSADVLKPAAPLKTDTPSTHKSTSTASTSAAINVSYRFVQNPVQVVVVFTNAADGQQVAQVPPEYVVKLVQFDHDKGELVDRDA
jgi:hypothetical protein